MGNEVFLPHQPSPVVDNLFEAPNQQAKSSFNKSSRRPKVWEQFSPPVVGSSTGSGPQQKELFSLTPPSGIP